MEQFTNRVSIKKKSRIYNHIQLFLLILIILSGFLFRVTGLSWDDNFHLHPDERFLTMVETAITPVDSLKKYFDTHSSSLNPHNRGYSFFVYGTFPIFLVRYIGEIIGKTGYNQIHLVGRYISAVADTLVIVLVFLLAKKLFKHHWLSVIAAAFYAFAVLPIQQSHYFTVDSIANLFSFLTLFFAICINKNDGEFNGEIKETYNKKDLFFHLFFGICLGFASASKINTIVFALTLPWALFLRDPSILRKSQPIALKQTIRNLLIAAFTAFIVFRIFQPYAFTGPGFFGLEPNQLWINNIKELSILSSGNTNFPPSLQWARRPIWFAVENLVKWGLGFPLGVIALLGLLFMFVRIMKGEWRHYILIGASTLIYLIWQSFRWNPTMRYFLFIYPSLCVIAAWFLCEYLIKINEHIKKIEKWKYGKIIGYILTFIIIFCTALWAFAFTRIYSEPVTRIAASEWIYRYEESAFNLDVEVETENYSYSHPIAYPHYSIISFDSPLIIPFTVNTSGFIKNILLDRFQVPNSTILESQFLFSIYKIEDHKKILLGQEIIQIKVSENKLFEENLKVIFKHPIEISNENDYLLEISLLNTDDALRISGYVRLEIFENGLDYSQIIFEASPYLETNEPYRAIFSPIESGRLNSIKIFRAKNFSAFDQKVLIQVNICDTSLDNALLLSEEIQINGMNDKDFRGNEYIVNFSTSIFLDKNREYEFEILNLEADTHLAFYGSKHANESSWDDALPLPMRGFNPFDSNNGLYYSDLNFEMYWDENQDKLARFIEVIELADYIHISSSRQWSSTTQIPERYPLTSLYYQELIGCPHDIDVQSCYEIAEPGMFQGQLGFDLIAVFQSEPSIGKFVINTQPSEEAFTVYDHPKVFIFKKNMNFDIRKVKSQFEMVDFDKVVQISPAKVSNYPANLLLPVNVWHMQQESGTWSEIFDTNSLTNSNHVIGVAYWYFALTLLGVIAFPLIKDFFRDFSDKGYALSKLSGLIIFSLISWLCGSLGLNVTRKLLNSVFFGLLSFSTFILYRKRKSLLKELHQNWKQILFIEFLFIVSFSIFLAIRIGNPDLWHPYKGGEKPMDFAYFNAVIKSSTFPPYDPWFSSGYINYYYFGFIIAGMLTKLLGIIPSLAYNMILPTFFAFTASAAYSIGYHFQKNSYQNQKKKFNCLSPLLSGFICMAFVLFIGNLGTIKMIFEGWQQIASGGLPLNSLNILQKVNFTLKGFILNITGASFRYYPGDWYWIPSRTIPGEPITEFPFFAFIYGDPHAHLFSYPITLLFINWLISSLFMKRKPSFKLMMLSIAFGGIVLAILRMTNTWDFYTFGFLSLVPLVFSLKKIVIPNWFFPFLSERSRKIFAIVFLLALGICIAMLFSLPFQRWYGQAYTSIDIWEGEKTPIGSLFAHWGIFLFFIVTLLFWLLYRWMAETPLSELRSLRKYRYAIYILGFIVLFSFALFIKNKIQISFIIFPLWIITALLLVRSHQTVETRTILYFILFGFSLLLGVEIFVVRGDIGRMNTVFKFYLQAWSLLSISAAVSLSWLIPMINGTKIKKEFSMWKIFCCILLMSGFLFPITGTIDKVKDRMNNNTPVTLDGTDFMKYSSYIEGDSVLNLSEDYELITWMLENIEGSPVIVEGHTSEYRWGNRISIYTGLPSVIGWNWHQRQQRALIPSTRITERITDVNVFYNTNNIEEAMNFIKKYNVKYIILGQLEQAIYDANGLKKLLNYDGLNWDQIYKNNNSYIFKVIES